MSIYFHGLVERRTRVIHAKALGPVTLSTGQMSAREHLVCEELELVGKSVETGTHLCRQFVADLPAFLCLLWASLLGQRLEDFVFGVPHPLPIGTQRCFPPCNCVSASLYAKWGRELT